MKKIYFILVVLMATVITSCEKTPRPISRISKEATYPTSYLSIPCTDDFTVFGRWLYGKRNTIKADVTYSLSQSPMLTTYDSNSVSVYRNSEGFHIISFPHETYRNDSLKFYFRYLDWSRNLQYNLRPDLIDPFDANQCYIEGVGRFTRTGYSITPQRMDVQVAYGMVYLGKDFSTGKKQIVLCNCKGKIYPSAVFYESFYTGRFTLPN